LRLVAMAILLRNAWLSKALTITKYVRTTLDIVVCVLLYALVL